MAFDLKRVVFSTALFFAFWYSSAAQDSAAIWFYNVENLFDTLNDPATNDDDFTPEGEANHTAKRYQMKLDHLAQVLTSRHAEGPSVLGLCEVENELVVRDLGQRISTDAYGVVHFTSSDERGIDNSLIYKTSEWKVVASGQKEVELGGEERPTRPIGWAVLERRDGKTQFAFIVNHWPSRAGGAEASANKRLLAAETCASVVVALHSSHPKAPVVVMGDFNDTPTDTSLLHLQQLCGEWLVNVSAANEGSYAYKGTWERLDQFLVDSRLFANKHQVGTSLKSRVVKQPWMLYESAGNFYPSRFYGGSRFFGGYSDHLPVYLNLPVSRK